MSEDAKPVKEGVPTHTLIRHWELVLLYDQFLLDPSTRVLLRKNIADLKELEELRAKVKEGKKEASCG